MNYHLLKVKSNVQLSSSPLSPGRVCRTVSLSGVEQWSLSPQDKSSAGHQNVLCYSLGRAPHIDMIAGVL